jgi:hypothetical protein
LVYDLDTAIACQIFATILGRICWLSSKRSVVRAAQQFRQLGDVGGNPVRLVIE